jgi:hypothetical protein
MTRLPEEEEGEEEEGEEEGEEEEEEDEEEEANNYNLVRQHPTCPLSSDIQEYSSD